MWCCLCHKTWLRLWLVIQTISNVWKTSMQYTFANDGSQISKFSYHFLHTCSIDSCFELTGPHRGGYPHFSKLTRHFPLRVRYPCPLNLIYPPLEKCCLTTCWGFSYSRLLPQNSCTTIRWKSKIITPWNNHHSKTLKTLKMHLVTMSPGFTPCTSHQIIASRKQVNA